MCDESLGSREKGAAILRGDLDNASYFGGFDDVIDNIDVTSLVSLGDADSEATSALMNAAMDGMSTRAGLQTEALQAAMDNYATAIDRSAIAKSTQLPVRTPSSQYKGFIAEEYFKHTLKINALAQGIPDGSLGVYTNGMLPDETTLSGIDMEADIVVFTRKYPWSRLMRESEWQAKIHDRAADYARDLANKQYERVQFVGGEGQGVNDTVKANLGSKTAESDAIAPERAAIMADDAKAQRTEAYPKRQEKLAELHSHELANAIKMGAATGFVYSTIREFVALLKNADNLSKEAFLQSAENILIGTAEGGARAGAINESVYLFGQILGREVTSSSLEAVPVKAATNVAVDFAKDLYRCFVTCEINTDDLLCNTVENAFSSAASFGGGWLTSQVGGQAVVQNAALLATAKDAVATGAAIGSPLGPIGSVIGSVVGGLLIGTCASSIIGVAERDGEKAFCALVEEIDSRIELEGCERIYYFADAMSSLSDFRLSFKDLLPCYNLISDLKEYNLHKKAIRAIEEQLETGLEGLDAKTQDVLRDVESRHRKRLAEIKASFADQRGSLADDYRDAIDTYIASSYAQYASTYEVVARSADYLRDELAHRKTEHSYVLSYMRNRNEINAELNDILSELVSDEEDRGALYPFIKRLESFIKQDRLLVGRQYVSYDLILALVDGGTAA